MEKNMGELLISYAVFLGIAAAVGFMAAAAGKHPSAWLARSVRRESSPTEKEEASQFYRRGQRYNAVGGLKGTHAWALAWMVAFTLPALAGCKLGEALHDSLRS